MSMQVVWNTRLLLWAVIIVLILNFFKFLWRRRWLYIYSWNVPGPTGLPFIGSALKFLFLKNKSMDFFFDLSEKYPKVWKLWVANYLFYGISEPKVIEKILTHPKCMDKDEFYSLKYLLGEGIGSAPVAKWKRHKKIIAPCFNQKVMDDFVDIFVKQSLVFVQKIEKYVGRKDIDIMHSTTPLFMDIVCETLMGLKSNAQLTKDDISPRLERVVEIYMGRFFSIWSQLDWLWQLHPLGKELKNHLSFFNNVIQTELIKKKRQVMEEKRGTKDSAPTDIFEGKKKLTFLELLLKQSDFTDEELHDEVKTFFVAGMDTTNRATGYLLEALALHPDIQQKVYEEVVDVVGERDVEAADLPELKYTERVIKETLRLFTISNYILRPIGEDIYCENYTIPKGAIAVFQLTNIQRNPQYWPNPTKFDPDRFVPEEVEKRPPCSYLPFSYGHKSCIGAKFAAMSMKTVIATAIKKYKFFTQYKSVEELKLTHSFLSAPTDGFKVYFELR